MTLKRGVSLGGLSDRERQDMLSLAWVLLPAVRMTEREANAALKAALADSLACLSTDHVELRRWLVDGAWLGRDGYGRVYERTPIETLQDAARERIAALQALPDVVAWVARLRQDHEVGRTLRRAQWQAQAGEPST